MRTFASDNWSPAHPSVAEAIMRVNVGHAPAYGDDPETAEAERVFQTVFGGETRAFPVFNGTGANVVSLAAGLRSWEGVICASTAHINVDECGAPERIAGCKLIDVATPDGKLTPEILEPVLTGFGVEHHVQPKMISVSQATEYGTVYRPDELQALASLAHSHGMLLHVDGARLANAAAFLGCGLREAAGVGTDIISFGGTKNGMLFGEAVIVPRSDTQSGASLVAAMPFARKQSGQLASKMRYISAQLVALLEDGLWERNASHANAMAARLADAVRDTSGVHVTQRVEANEVFAIVPPHVVGSLQAEFPFHVWNEATSEVRWVASWDTQAEDVDRLLMSLIGHLADS